MEKNKIKKIAKFLLRKNYKREEMNLYLHGLRIMESARKNGMSVC